MSRAQTWLSVLLLLIVGGLMGVISNMVKLAVSQGWQPVAFLLWSLLGAGVVLLLLAIARGQAPSLQRSHLRYYLVSGLISLTLPNALLFSAIPHVGAGYAAMCLAFPPLITYLLALALKMEPARALRMLGIAIGLLGSLLLAVDKASSGDSPLAWVLAVLATPVFLALGNIYRSRSWPTGATPLALAPGMLLAGALLLTPAALIVDLSPLHHSPTALWLLLAQVLLFSTMYALYFMLQKIAGAVFLSQMGSVTALSGAGLAIYVFGEPGSPVMGLAALCITLGVVLVALRRAPNTAQGAST